jgi:sulfatase modifying factor 1
MGICRPGAAGEAYSWGSELKPGGKWMANTYQGRFPIHIPAHQE